MVGSGTSSDCFEARPGCLYLLPLQQIQLHITECSATYLWYVLGRGKGRIGVDCGQGSWWKFNTMQIMAAIGESQAQTNCHEIHSACAFSTHNSMMGPWGLQQTSNVSAAGGPCPYPRHMTCQVLLSCLYRGSKAKSISLRSIADICWVAEPSAPALLHRTPLLHKLYAQFRRQANACNWTDTGYRIQQANGVF